MQHSLSGKVTVGRHENKISTGCDACEGTGWNSEQSEACTECNTPPRCLCTVPTANKEGTFCKQCGQALESIPRADSRKDYDMATLDFYRTRVHELEDQISVYKCRESQLKGMVDMLVNFLGSAP